MSKTQDEIVKEFCHRLNPNFEAVIVDIKPEDGAAIGAWKANVEAKVKKDGGECLEGWAIWYQDDIIVEGEACAIWKSPKGEYLDITPREEEYPQIMFVEEKGIWNDGGPVANKRQALSDNPIARMVFKSGEWRDRLRKQFGSEAAIPEEEINKMDTACQRIMTRDVRNWERCPCGSAKQFTKCCGKPKGRPLSNF
jgi:hypothetical protein